MNHVYLGLGSNLGDRQTNLQKAVNALTQGMLVTAVSPIYETPPWGVTAQPAFLNLCVAAQTAQSPQQLLSLVKALESELGRQPTYRWEPRLIDIDLLFYNDLVLTSEQLTIPHPRLAERAFVLVPLADLAPNLAHPQTGKTVQAMAAAVDTTHIEQRTELFVRVPATG